MDQFINDIWTEFTTYYEVLVRWIPSLIIGLIVLTFFLLIARGLRRILVKYLDGKTEEQLVAQFIVRIVYSVLIVIGIVAALSAGGFEGVATNLLAGAGLSAVILGFAFKDIGENFLAGFLLAFKRPFRIGDLVEVENSKGRITGLNLRETMIKTLDGKDIFIPNSMIIKNPIVNYTLDGNFRDSFVLGLDYSEDIGLAINLIIDTIKGLNNGLGTGKEPAVIIKDLGTSSLNLEVHFWLVTDIPEYSIPGLRTMVVKEVLAALTQAGFYLPGDILEIKNYKNENWRMDGDNREKTA